MHKRRNFFIYPYERASANHFFCTKEMQKNDYAE